MSATWPKTFPPLTAEQERISNDFMQHWHEVLPKRYGAIERFNQAYPVRHAPAEFLRTLEIGAGLGGHLEFERLTPEQEQNYYALELRENMAREIRRKYPRIRTCVADCEERMPFPDGFFDRVLAIHVLEHLRNLPAAVAEMRRVCGTAGICSVVIPCEGGFAYGMARRVSAQRIFEKRYGQPYRWFIEREHVNRPDEILNELSRSFSVTHQSYFPLGIPAVELNLCIGITLRPL